MWKNKWENNHFDSHSPSKLSSSTTGATFKEYFLSKEFFLTLGLLVGGGITLLMVVFFIILPLLTRHGSTAVVPSLCIPTDKKKYVFIEEAIEKINDAGLQAVIKDCVYVAGMPAGVVLEQEPVPYAIVKPGRKVFLVVSKKVPQLVKLPNILNVSITEAKQNLINWDFKIGKLIEIPSEDDQVKKAYYQGKAIEPGISLPKGSIIDLEYGKIINKNVPLPDVTKLSLDEALNKLSSVGLCGIVVKTEFGTKYPANIVLRQYPSPRKSNDSIQIGKCIDLWISGEPQNIPAEGLPEDE
ncbi:MAG: PASTA domain-containing protein [Bacteroidia bacterium]|nr:PASTA domain-containing protein [Bacteroidia bacterium]MDW8159115.1 PASTA domain-containing protein [Bacteroidia bacterium]